VLWIEVNHGMATVILQRHHFGKESSILPAGSSLRQHGIEFIELRL
jgi:hypothetical protein